MGCMDLAALATLPLAERLQAMEVLWDSLCRDDSADVSPAWHAEVLTQRLANIDPAAFGPLDEVEAKLRRELGFK